MKVTTGSVFAGEKLEWLPALPIKSDPEAS